MTTKHPAKQNKKISKKELKQRYVDAGYCDKDTKWYWDKEEKVWCLPLKDIILGER